MQLNLHEAYYKMLIFFMERYLNPHTPFFAACMNHVLPHPHRSRLGCQVYLTKDLSGMEVKVPAGVNDARGTDT